MFAVANRQEVKLKAAFKPVALKHDLQNELFKRAGMDADWQRLQGSFSAQYKIEILNRPLVADANATKSKIEG
ncbi:hypothetical protein [Pseudoalteromonas phenolica]|uniref:hypothetical protein n=1 Tax=Pseudoalteromonas phenolica TaxID=161398 RepID=UPI00384FFFC2